jgi:uncharacterized membrane protein
MNDAHIHLVVNHLPIIFPVVGLIVMVTGLIAKSEHVKRTAYLIFSIGAVAAFAAMSTGEGAEEIVEKVGGISESYIESHEEAAELFAILSYILGGISLFGLWASFKQKTYSDFIPVGTVVFAIVVLFFAKQTGTTGGEVRHTEIRTGTSISINDAKNTEAAEGHEDEDD